MPAAKKRAPKSPQHPSPPGTTTQEGLVIANYGAALAVEDSNHTVHRCVARHKTGTVVCGDRVLWSAQPQQDGMVITVLPRRSLLARLDPNGKDKAIAANVDQVVIVIAPEIDKGGQQLMQACDFEIIDRYIAAAELNRMRPVIVTNKIDLLTEQNLALLQAALGHYAALAYPVLYVSVATGAGLETLTRQLQNQTNVCVGQSGVGKSSLIKNIIPREEEIRIGDLSLTSGKGKHTTTRSTLYHLPQGGHLIDSPGVREFGLWKMSPPQLAQGFIDFRPYISLCKFNDCTHRDEPGCAVQAAVKQGAIHPQRLAHYRAIVASFADQIDQW